MTEKRFFTKINKNGTLVIIDKECHIEIIDITLACEVLNRLDLKLKTYNEQLGEQQSIIRRDEISIKTMMSNMKKLEEENEQLREINKEISYDLHNCRLNKNIISEKLKLWQDVHKEYNIYSIKDFEELLNELKEENEKLLKQINDCKDYNALLYQNSMKSDKEWIKNVQKPLEKELEESIQESTELRKQNMELERRVHILSAILLSDECSLSEKRIGEIKEEVFE